MMMLKVHIAAIWNSALNASVQAKAILLGNHASLCSGPTTVGHLLAVWVVSSMLPNTARHAKPGADHAQLIPPHISI